MVATCSRMINFSLYRRVQHSNRIYLFIYVSEAQILNRMLAVEGKPASNEAMFKVLRSVNLDPATPLYIDDADKLHLAAAILRGTEVLLLLYPTEELMSIVTTIGMSSLVMTEHERVEKLCTDVIRFTGTTLVTEPNKHKVTPTILKHSSCLLYIQTGLSAQFLKKFSSFLWQNDKVDKLLTKVKQVELERNSARTQEQLALTELQKFTKSANLQTSELQSTVNSLELNTKKLQQENFELRGATSNMIGTFPTLEEVVARFYSLGQQHIVEFVFSCEKVEFTKIVRKIKRLACKLEKISSRQRTAFYAKVAPAPVAVSHALERELNLHLQANYKEIMDLKEFLHRKSKTIVPKLDVAIPNFEEAFLSLACEIHDFLWIVTLTPNLGWGAQCEYTKSHHQNLLDSDSPTVVFPPLVRNGKVIALGFAL